VNDDGPEDFLHFMDDPSVRANRDVGMSLLQGQRNKDLRLRRTTK
jgi:hypothetical protein